MEGVEVLKNQYIVKVVANKDTLQIKNTFVQSNLSENTSSHAYLA